MQQRHAFPPAENISDVIRLHPICTILIGGAPPTAPDGLAERLLQRVQILSEGQGEAAVLDGTLHSGQGNARRPSTSPTLIE